jgi:hypothetical protein
MGIWGIEYDSGAGGLNFWKPFSPCYSNLMNYALFLKNNGNVGIGVSNPQTKLEIDGGLTAWGTIGSVGGVGSVYLGNAYNLDYGTSYLGFNAKRNGTSWSIVGDGANNGAGVIWSNIVGTIYFSSIPSTGTGSKTITDATVKNNIKLAITAAGLVKAKEILVTLTGWPDYVFHPEYKLLSLPEKEAYIKANGHLPDMPSAAEVETSGVKLGEMNALLLKQIEELTLQMIAMQKQIDQLSAEIKKGGE